MKLSWMENVRADMDFGNSKLDTAEEKMHRVEDGATEAQAGGKVEIRAELQLICKHDQTPKTHTASVSTAEETDQETKIFEKILVEIFQT